VSCFFFVYGGLEKWTGVTRDMGRDSFSKFSGGVEAGVFFRVAWKEGR
jgi:hypothetical protein